jgi:hypothetical protein
MMTSPSDGWPPTSDVAEWSMAFEERAGIVEHDGRMSRAVAESKARKLVSEAYRRKRAEEVRDGVR